MRWVRFFEKLYLAFDRGQSKSKVSFRDPADNQELAAIERDLNLQVPKDLRELLSESNGVMDLIELGGKFSDNMWVVWPTEEIKGVNSMLRELPEHTYDGFDFEYWLFFAGAGADGILFGLSAKGPELEKQQVHVWHPIDNTITPIATTLEDFFSEWLLGNITV